MSMHRRDAIKNARPAPAESPAVVDGIAAGVGLGEQEREALYSAGDHGPETCDCDAYIIEQAFAEDCCCQGLLDTFATVERILAAHVATARAEERERIAQAIEAMESFAHGKNEASRVHRLGYGTARRLAARIARTEADL